MAETIAPYLLCLFYRNISMALPLPPTPQQEEQLHPLPGNHEFENLEISDYFHCQRKNFQITITVY